MSAKKIVLGFDRTPEARDALALADRMASLEQAQIVVVNAHEIPTLPGSAVDPDPDVFAGSHLALEMATEALPNRTVETRVVASSSTARALHDVADAEAADLIVIGSTHRAGLGRVFPGSVGERLMHGAPCAVAVAPRGYARREHFGLGEIGVAFDGGAESRLALAEARRLAEHAPARLKIIAVLPAETENLKPEVRRKLREDLEEQLAEAAEFARQPAAGENPVTVETALLEGDPASVLADQGIELDLLVVGSRAYGPVLRTLVGGVSEALMRLAPCPVVVVPRGGHKKRSPQAVERTLGIT